MSSSEQMPAVALESGAAEILLAAASEKEKLTRQDCFALAQGLATLALSARVAELTERLGDYMAEDSFLDRIAECLRDPVSGMGIAELTGRPR